MDVVLYNGPKVLDTFAAMAADQVTINATADPGAYEGKRWEPIGGTGIHRWENHGGTWAYYLETTTDASGAIPTTSATLLAGEDQDNDVLVVEQGKFGYQVVPVTTQTTLGTGAAGDYLHKILVGTSTTVVTIRDGTDIVYTWAPLSATGIVELELNCICGTNWSLACIGAGATAIGRFTA